jgi:hypothetical protein
VSISLRAKAQKFTSATALPPLTISLNLAAGGDFSPAPVAGDVVHAAVYYADDSGLPQFSGPAGWTLIRSQSFVAADIVYQVWGHLVGASEAAYTWTATNNGQANQVFVTHAFDLAGAFQGAYNPGGQDPAPFAKINQAGALTQTASNASMAAADSALMAGWGMDIGQTYSGIGTINSVVPATLFDSHLTPGAGFSAATGLWLAPGIGTWVPTATATGTFGKWGAVRWGIRVQPPPPPPPIIPPAYGVRPAFVDERPRRMRRWLST